MKFTIFTPTYNRAYTLPKLYYSLVKQTFKDFEWLIVDDGSTDDTRNLVEGWIKEGVVKIRYINKKNSGKQRSYNIGIKSAFGELFICIDSDDQYTEDALEKILYYWNEIEDKNKYAGLGYLSIYSNGELIGSQFPGDIFDSNHFDIYFKHGVRGDKGLMFKTSVLRRFYFPEIEGERFITEATLYNRISREYKIRYLNERLEIKDYYPDGLTAKYREIMLRNPVGSALYHNERNYFKMSLKDQVLNAAVYVKYSLLAKRGILQILEKSKSNKVLTIFSLPLGMFMYFKEGKG